MGLTFDFRDRVVLVTGVGRAGQIGHAVAQAFGDAGARLVLSDRNAVGLAERLKEFAGRGLDVRPAAGDLSDPSVAEFAVETAVRQFGRLDVLVNVAGGLTTYGSFSASVVEEFDREIAINLKTAYLVTRAAIEPLASHGGAVVNFASVAYFHPVQPMAIYSAAKSAVAGLTRSLALELQPRGIRVNAVAPGMVRTVDNLASVSDKDVRWVEMGEITAGVMFLASDAASAVTGHILPLTGTAV